MQSVVDVWRVTETENRKFDNCAVYFWFSIYVRLVRNVHKCIEMNQTATQNEQTHKSKKKHAKQEAGKTEKNTNT